MSAFAPIFLCPKKVEPKMQAQKSSAQNFRKKAAHKMMVKLTPEVNCSCCSENCLQTEPTFINNFGFKINAIPRPNLIKVLDQ